MSTMTDKELLELAAKAAGLRVVDSDAAGLRISSDDCCTGYRWNPLTDDGDALRLAVKLEFTVGYAELSGFAVVQTKHWGNFSEYCLQGSGIESKDIYAATRRAIVRAAAEIGKTK